MDIMFKNIQIMADEYNYNSVSYVFMLDEAAVEVTLRIPKSIKNLDDLTKEALKRGCDLLSECLKECSKQGRV
jgi:accessory colonization factor AcfC